MKPDETRVANTERPDSGVLESQPDDSTHRSEYKGHAACPVCGFPIGAVQGSKAAVCGNCGFKDGCC